MPELIDQMYCAQQIIVPPQFPYILKKYCKAAIKTQPYDLLLWSYEYFSALAEGRPPPVKLRLEYPIYSTEGGLTRGCLKVLVHQHSNHLPVAEVKAAWKGFCLDPQELARILCLCEVYLREEEVPFLHFIAVAGGLLTKTLTHTMILLCEALTAEPDGGSAAIPVQDFLTMYRFLAQVDASTDVKYINGRREDAKPPSPSVKAAEEKKENEEHADGICGQARRGSEPAKEADMEGCTCDLVRYQSTEEDIPLPEVTVVYAVPGIGAPVDPETIKEFEEYALDVSKAQADMFMPRNIRHFMCPPLQIYEEPNTDKGKKEEVPMTGVITD
ncbi:ropporin-1-like protein isoform X2 [Aricia agestis]|uniref:ropporin-1-like protein isoform X2 n=1 Tax=Aricia agestis TaxID=91739 RepID=UPI001C203852|nr:ropporin-1-like protein isoform X2 [Aricia agestis]